MRGSRRAVHVHILEYESSAPVAVEIDRVYSDRHLQVGDKRSGYEKGI